MEVYAWLIDLIRRRKNCPTGMIFGWVQKVTQHHGTIQYFWSIAFGVCLNLAEIRSKPYPFKNKEFSLALGTGDVQCLAVPKMFNDELKCWKKMEKYFLIFQNVIGKKIKKSSFFSTGKINRTKNSAVFPPMRTCMDRFFRPLKLSPFALQDFYHLREIHEWSAWDHYWWLSFTWLGSVLVYGKSVMIMSRGLSGGSRGKEEEEEEWRQIWRAGIVLKIYHQGASQSINNNPIKNSSTFARH